MTARTQPLTAEILQERLDITLVQARALYAWIIATRTVKISRTLASEEKLRAAHYAMKVGFSDRKTRLEMQDRARDLVTEEQEGKQVAKA